jgi:zinc protease
MFLFTVGAAIIGTGCSKGETPGPAGETRAPAPVEKSKVKLVPLKVESEPIIVFKLAFHTGSMDDPDGKNGLAYLTARMMSDGATKKNSYQEILKKLYPMASSYYVQVDREYITFTGSTHLDNIEGFYPLFKEAILEPGFLPEDFNRLKSESIDFIKTAFRYSSDEELGKAVFKSFAYRGTPYEKNIMGKVSDLESITLEDVKNFYRSHFGRDKLIVGISGNFPDNLAARINDDFSRLPAVVKAPGKPIVPGEIKGLRVVIVEKPGESTGIHIGFPIKLMRKDTDFHALFLANSWLGEHRNSSSHLYQVIREARGMNYGDYSYIEDFPNGGRRQFPPTNVYKNPQLFEIWIRPVETDKRLFALRAALGELKTFVENGMTPEDFELTKKFLSRYCLHFAATNSQRLGYKMDDVIFGLTASHLDNFRENIEKLTLEQVNAAIKKYLQYENLKIVFVTANAETLKNDLINNAPSPITYRSPKPEGVLKEDKIIEVFPLNVPAENVEIIKVDRVFQ